MSNLKKIIALSVAAATSLSMFASAVNFVDASDITGANREAVNALVALNVINGKVDTETGETSFDPMGDVTRAEMAKMIYVIMNGGVDDGANQWKYLDINLNDVDGHWAEGYIKFCANQGIIVGNGDGTYLPEAKVTSTAVLKMALVVLGYDDERAGLVGSDWDQNVLRLSQAKQLYKDAGITDYNSPASRQTSAQILYNLLNANTVFYSAENGQYVDNTVSAGSGNQSVDFITAGEKYMNLKESEDVLDSYKKIGSLDVVTDLLSLVGQKVNYQYNDKEDEVYGATAHKDVNVVEKLAYDVDNAAKTYDVLDDNVSIDELNAKGVEFYVNGTTATYADVVAVLNNSDKSSSVFKFIDNNDNEKFDSEDALSVYTVEVAEVTVSNDEKIRANATDYKYEDNQIAEEIADEDFVAITKVVAEDEDGDLEIVNKVEELEVQTGKVDAVRENDNTFRVADDDTFYKNANSTKVLNTDIGNTYEFVSIDAIAYDLDEVDSEISAEDYVIVQANNSVTTDLGETTVRSTIRFYNDTTKAGYIENIIFVSGSTETAYNVVRASGQTAVGADPVAGSSSTVQGTDGYINTTDKTIAIYAVDSGAIEYSEFLTSSLFTYEINDNGNYDLTYVGNASATDNGTNANIVDKTDKLQVGASTLDIADDATIFVRYTTPRTSTAAPAVKFDVISGEEFAAWKGDGTSGYSVDFNITTVTDSISGINYVTVGFANLSEFDGTIGENVPNSSGSESYGYIVSNAYNSADDTVTFTVWNGTEDVTYTAETNSFVNVTNIKKGTILKYDLPTSGNKISNVTAIYINDSTSDTDLAAVTGSNKTTIAVFKEDGTPVNYAIDEDTVIMYVNTSDDVGVADGSINAADEDKSDIYYANAIVTATAGVAELIVIDEAGSFSARRIADAAKTSNVSIASVNPPVGVTVIPSAPTVQGRTATVTVEVLGIAAGESYRVSYELTAADGTTTTTTATVEAEVDGEVVLSFANLTENKTIEIIRVINIDGTAVVAATYDVNSTTTSNVTNAAVTLPATVTEPNDLVVTATFTTAPVAVDTGVVTLNINGTDVEANEVADGTETVFTFDVAITDDMVVAFTGDVEIA